MEWETEGDGEDLGGQGVDRAFTLLHPAPPSPKKAKGGKSGVHALDPHAHVARDLLLAGFPPCFKGEEVPQRLRRAAASEACVSRLKTSISVSRGSETHLKAHEVPHPLGRSAA